MIFLRILICRREQSVLTAVFYIYYIYTPISESVHGLF